MESLYTYRYSFLAGAFAAGGSFFGKMPSYLKSLDFLPASIDFIVLQLLPLGLMLFCNVCNLRYFLKALQMTPQTLTATVLTAASNYVMSFILGIVVYNEPLSPLSAIGITFILAGLWFLCDDSDSTDKNEGLEKKAL
ncbi:uncharacterized protein Dwil_GK27191 [Drosophila willistoni]|uniref:EamA domain-containing protein n=1 Tax=Drosophila willistoni TaxID=7260 RepID=A0A0Q9X3V8_DROWI|nr:uncharacterized protein LOC26529193 [Drosophila willistoni]KRF98999.1 uncharacterized protein Dwil_GK27191 [Drosophila willistoni]